MKHTPNIFYQSSCTDKEFDDYLLLGGGTDINPKIYGQEPLSYTQIPNNARDVRNIASINKAVEEGKPIFGICRGFQLLDAVFGGQLIQHTVGHPNGVAVLAKDKYGLAVIRDCHNCHHQVVDIHQTKGEVLGKSVYKYKAYFGDSVEVMDTVPQILYWPEKKALAVQFHPEWQNEQHSMNVHLRGLIKDLLGLENVL